MLDKTTKGRLIAAAGGIVLIISLFLSWYKIKAGVFASAGASGWEALGLGDIVLFIIGLLAILPAALDIFELEIELPVDMSLVTLGAGALATLEVLFRIINKPGPDIDIPGVGVSLSYGIFVALIAALAVVYGGFLQMSEEPAGGDGLYGGTDVPAPAPPATPAASPPPSAAPGATPPAPPTPPPAPSPPATPPAPPAQPPAEPQDRPPQG